MTRARTLWDEGTEPGRQVVALGVALALTTLFVDLLAGHDVGWIFDVAFVLLCPLLALLVRPHDFYVIAVTPPLLMLALFLTIGLVDPGTVARPDDTAVQAALSGMAHHSAPLLIGYALCLSCLEIRRRRIIGGRAEPQSSKRSGSPAPRRTTVAAPSE